MSGCRVRRDGLARPVARHGPGKASFWIYAAKDKKMISHV
jgi:hypothetical protein